MRGRKTISQFFEFTDVRNAFDFLICHPAYHFAAGDLSLSALDFYFSVYLFAENTCNAADIFVGKDCFTVLCGSEIDKFGHPFCEETLVQRIAPVFIKVVLFSSF